MISCLLGLLCVLYMPRFVVFFFGAVCVFYVWLSASFDA